MAALMKKRNHTIDSDISAATIHTRAARGQTDPKQRGAKSPLADAEETLVQICIQMGQILQHLRRLRIRGNDLGECLHLADRH